MRRIKVWTFRRRLFIPLVILVWVITGVFVGYQYFHETSLRKLIMRQHLSILEQRILHSYEQGDNIQEMLTFVKRYYEKSIYNDIHITIYDSNDSILAAIGSPVPAYIDTLPDLEPEIKDYQLVNTGDEFGSHELFYISSVVSDDGRILVRTALPNTFGVDRELNTHTIMWGLVVMMLIISTLTVYLSTVMVARNIEKMQALVARMAAGEDVPSKDSYSHDELGDLARDISDIYEQRSAAMARSEREHRIAIHAIEEKARMKRQMTNNINHELKTPIGVVRGYLDTINSNPDMDAETRDHFLQRARENVERLCSLLNDISAITRLDDGSEHIPVTAVDMHELVYGIDNDIRSANLIPGMTFNYSIPLDCRVIGNQNLLSAMLLNLVKNARIHSHGTEIHLRLISESEKFYVFAFYDNGSGVGPEHIPHLFDRFYRVDSGRSRKAGGTGLGLPIVQSTIVSLGGTISVHNRSTGGLEFVFSLRKADT